MSGLEINIDGAARASLQDWLTREPLLRGQVSISRAPIAEGQMGGAVVLAVAAASPAVIRALSNALTNWMAQRRSETTIELKGPDGKVVSVTNKGPSRPEDLLQQINSVLDTTPEPTSPAKEQ